MKTLDVIIKIVSVLFILAGIMILIAEEWFGILYIVAGVGVLVLYGFLDDTEDKLKGKEQQIKIKKIFGTITESFCDGTKMDETTLRRIYDINNLNESFESFANFLDNYLNTLLNEKDDRISYGKNAENKDNKTSYDDINSFLSSIILREKEDKPFEGVEGRSRKLLQDIDKASKEKNFEAVNSGLKYLANIMIENQKIYSKENLKNSRFAKISGVATILSLVFAIIIFIIQNHLSLTGEDVKKNMIEVIDTSVVKDTINQVNYPLKYENGSRTTSDQ